MGDIDKVLSECKYTVDEVYHTKADQQCMMETFRTYCTKDYFGRLNVVSSTQVPFHLRRILGNALGIPILQDPRDQASYWRRLWSQADRGL